MLKMKLEFPEQFKEISDSAVKNLTSELTLKLSLVRIAEVLDKKKNLSGTLNMRSAFTIRLLEGFQKKQVNKIREPSPQNEAYIFNPIEAEKKLPGQEGEQNIAQLKPEGEEGGSPKGITALGQLLAQLKKIKKEQEELKVSYLIFIKYNPYIIKGKRKQRRVL